MRVVSFENRLTSGVLVHMLERRCFAVGLRSLTGVSVHSFFHSSTFVFMQHFSSFEYFFM